MRALPRFAQDDGARSRESAVRPSNACFWSGSSTTALGTLALVGVFACSGTIGPTTGGSPGSNTGNNGQTSNGGGTNNGGAGDPGTDNPSSAASPLGRLDSATAKACPTALDPGPALNRRLTRREYNNTVSDLLGDTSAPAKNFPSDERTLNFDNNAAALTVSPELAEDYESSAATLAAAAVTNSYATLVSCDPTKAGNDACGETFIRSFGQRAFRRPVTDAEVTTYKAVLTQGLMTDFKHGVSLVIESMLQSAPFLYRVEFGDSSTAPSGMMHLSSWEMASRLSYFLWASMPDSTLLTAAAAGKLATTSDITAQVTRMLDDPKTHRMVQSFHEQYLGLADAVSIDKDATLFPAWTPDMLTTLKLETSQFVDDVVWNGGDFNKLLTAPTTFVNADVAKLYGLPAAQTPAGTAWQKVSFDPTQRGGLLTQGSFLAFAAKTNQTSPVLRGKFVRNQMLCAPPPPPPPGLNVQVPSLDPNLTTRERFAMHSINPACATCHKLMDPVGLGFETFDAVGRYRPTENGKPIDNSGQLYSTDVDGPFKGPIELATKLASSDEVKRCYVTNWFRFAYGRSETDGDACLLNQLDAGFVSAQSGLKTMITTLTQTDAFYYRRAGGSQ